MTDETLIDALPYFDKGYDEAGVREAALALIEEETKIYKNTKNYLVDFPLIDAGIYETEIMKNEFERLAARQPMELLSMKRYELPAPPSGSKTDVAAWEEYKKNSEAQLNHQEVRMENLELMQQHGTNSWKVHNEFCEVMLKEQQKASAGVKRKIQEVNWDRKKLHTEAGTNLMEDESKWVGLIGKNYEIEEAIVKLQYQMQAAKQRKTTE